MTTLWEGWAVSWFAWWLRAHQAALARSEADWRQRMEAGCSAAS